jgi:hypothetical protein
MTISQPDRDRALSYPLEHVLTRYRLSHDVPPAVALLHERELKRYLLLCAEYPDISLPVSPVIDELWHEFLLHTRDYMAFCNDLAGGFIHHVPMTAIDSRPAAARQYEILLTLYEEEFRELPPADVWPRVATNETRRADCSSDVDVFDRSSDGEPRSDSSPRFMRKDGIGDCRAERRPDE